MVSELFDEILSDPGEVVSEREAFLMRELQSMFEAEGLLSNPNDVLIVAARTARTAWPEYNQFHAYVCQPNRPFQQVSRMGFYSGGNIYPLVPQILATYNDVEIRRNGYDGELGKLVEYLLDNDLRPEGQRFKVVLLSAPDAQETVKLTAPILNDMTAKSGRPVAFTMGQRYATLDALRRAKVTSELG